MHFKLCEHKKIRYLHTDPFVEIGICYQCKIRIGNIKPGLPKLLQPLARIYIHWCLSKVFRDKISWWDWRDF